MSKNSSNTRINTIINEIRYWKDTNLLPEQYCDYLLQLYSEGAQAPEIKEKAVLAQRLNEKQSLLLILKRYGVTLSFFVILLGGALLFYFSDISQQMQISPIYILVLFLIATFIVGVVKRIFAIQCIALLMLILTFAWLSNNLYGNSEQMWRLEGMWTALGLLSLGFAKLIEKQNKMLTLTLYINGVLAFFIPTLLLFFGSPSDTNIIQFVVLFKLIVFSLSLMFWNPLVYVAQLDNKE